MELLDPEIDDYLKTGGIHVRPNSLMVLSL